MGPQQILKPFISGPMSERMLSSQRSTTRSSARQPKPSRRTPEEECELVTRVTTLEFRGKHVLRARALAELVEECRALPGLGEASERLVDFFEDTENGNWVDGSGLFRLARADHLNRLKRNWREFETRRSTLRQYLRTTSRSKLADGTVQFKFPQERFESPKAFISAYRQLVGALDQLSRMVLKQGFRVEGFYDHSTVLVVEAESDAAFGFASQLVSHYRWYQEQSKEVRSLEERASISEEYAKAGKNLASALLRHLRVLVQDTVQESMTNPDAERIDKATALCGEYIKLLGEYAQEGATVTLAEPAHLVELAA